MSSVRSLTRLVMTALESATLQIEAQAMKFANTQLPPLREESSSIAESFMINLNAYLDDLFEPEAPEAYVTEYGNLSLIDDDYLEAVIAMEGMVNHVRNCDIQQYLSFTTRLDSIFPSLHIDETNNPLAPEQIGESFSAAIKPMGLKAHYLLTIYREFNKAVFHQLEEVLAEANEVLIDCDVLPQLDIKVRNREIQKNKRTINRPTTDRETRAFEEAAESSQTNDEDRKSNTEMFAMMQVLVKGLAEKDQGQTALPVNTAEPAADQQAIKQQQIQLLEM